MLSRHAQLDLALIIPVKFGWNCTSSFRWVVRTDRRRRSDHRYFVAGYTKRRRVVMLLVRCIPFTDLWSLNKLQYFQYFSKIFSVKSVMDKPTPMIQVYDFFSSFPCGSTIVSLSANYYLLEEVLRSVHLVSSYNLNIYTRQCSLNI